MLFITQARSFVSNPNQSLPRWQEMRETLDYLLRNNHIGHRNAVSTDIIVQHLNDSNFHINREQWEQEVLGPLRDRRIFIGSSRRGIFIIDDRSDAVEVYRLYATRILAESERLGILSDLIRQANWSSPQINIR